MAQRLIVEIIGDASSLNRTFRQVERQTQTFGTKMRRAASAGVFAGATAGVIGLTAALKSGFSELNESQKVAAQTAAALKSTGQVAGVTGRQIEKLATTVQRYSGADDEAVQAAENLLLTFTNIRNVAGQGNDVFNQTTRAVADVSQAFDKDLSASAIQLGKALNDPARGLTALRRIGISFTDDQVNLIRRLSETGHMLEAQQLILREVNREVGGSARAFGQQLPGQLKIAQGNIENITGSIAQGLSPEILKLLKRFNRWAENQDNVNNLVERSESIFHDAAAAADVLAKAVGGAADAYIGLRGAVGRTNDWFERHGLGFLNKGLLETVGVIGGGGGGARGPGPPGLRGPTGRRTRPDELPPWLRGSATGPLVPGVAPPGAPPTAGGGRGGGVTAAQRNAWFDAMVARMLGRVDDPSSLRAQISRLRVIAGLITQRLAVTKDITRRLTLEGQLADIARDVRSRQQQIADKIKADRAANLEDRFGWLQFAAERAEATKTLKDDIKAQRMIERFLKERIRHEGRTLDLVRELWRTRQKIRDLNKTQGDPLAGLQQVSSRRLAAILAAGTGLGVAGRRTLEANIAGAEIQPLTIHTNVHIDGQHVATAVNRANARTAHRTARQTSGYRG